MLLPKQRDTLVPYAFLLPALVLFATFSIYPFVLLTYTSFFEWDGIGPLNLSQFVGLQNYWHVIAHDHVFWKSFLQAGYITMLALTVQNAMALLLAIAVNRKLAGASLYRTLFFLP